MKNLIIYFSLEGNTKFIAESIAEEIECDIMELIPSKKYSTGKIGKYFWGGKSVLFGEEPELINPPIDMGQYDTVIIGTPVWAGSFAPPIKSLISQYHIAGKRIGIFACHGGGGAAKCFDKLKKALPGNEFLGQIDFVEPKRKSEENCRKAFTWASGFSSL